AAMTRPDPSALPSLPSAPPYALRARVLTPLAAGGTRYESDALVTVGVDGRISAVERWDGTSAPAGAVDMRPMVLLPGLVDLHVHLPQVPAAGLGAGMDLRAWLERHVFDRERAFRAAAARAQLPAILREMAAC